MKYLINLRTETINKSTGGCLLKVKKKDISKLSDFDLLQMLHERYLAIGFKKMNVSQKALSSLFIILGDVGNGGFIQLFENTKGEFNKEGLTSLKLIGDRKMLEIFSAAEKVFEKNKKHLTTIPYPGPLKESEAKKLEKLEAKFFRQSEKTDKILTSYVKKHLQDFVEII